MEPLKKETHRNQQESKEKGNRIFSEMCTIACPPVFVLQTLKGFPKPFFDFSSPECCPKVTQGKIFTVVRIGLKTENKRDQNRKKVKLASNIGVCPTWSNDQWPRKLQTAAQTRSERFVTLANIQKEFLHILQASCCCSTATDWRTTTVHIFTWHGLLDFRARTLNNCHTFMQIRHRLLKSFSSK